MTGWRLGYMIAPTYINQVAGMINESITYSAPTASQRGGIYALKHYEELVPPTVAIFKERLAYIEKEWQKFLICPCHLWLAACMLLLISVKAA